MLDIEFDDPDAEYLYRYTEEMEYSRIDDFGDITHSFTVVNIQKFKVISWTSKGCWIDRYGEKRFVLLTARKKFACKTKLDAIESFLVRKQVHLSYLKKKIKHIESSVVIAKRVKNKLGEINGKSD